MTRATRSFSAVTLALALATSVAGRPGVARADNRPAPTAADFARLEKEVADQRQLIIQIMQSEQERYDILLKLLQGSGRGPWRPRASRRGHRPQAAPPRAPGKSPAPAPPRPRKRRRSGR